MFTGLIEEVGRVGRLEHANGVAPHGASRASGAAVLAVQCDTVVSDAAIGDSIAVNGCCLTVTALPDEGGFLCDMMGETLDRTALGDLVVGAPVNLERAMPAGARLGGHLVQGHVDGVARITAIEPHQDWTTMTYELPDALRQYVVEKGSITVDGTSLTVMGVTADTFSVGLIPHTMAVTTHGSQQVGNRVNIEVDIIAKYVERQLAPYTAAIGV